MSLNLNKIMIAGRLTADPEMKMTTSGKSVVNVQVAVNRYTKEGEKQEADFITVVAFEKRAEIICRHFAKGFPIYVEGQLQIRQWTDRDGQKETRRRSLHRISGLWNRKRRHKPTLPPKIRP